MNCTEIQSELSAYIDGELPSPVQTEVDTHLATCALCQKRVAELRKLAEGVAALPKIQPAPQFLEQVRRKIARGERPKEETWFDLLFRPVWLKVPLEALALIALMGTVMMLNQQAMHRESQSAMAEKVQRRDERLESLRVAQKPAPASEPTRLAGAPAGSAAPIADYVSKDRETVAAAPASPATPPALAKAESVGMDRELAMTEAAASPSKQGEALTEGNEATPPTAAGRAEYAKAEPRSESFARNMPPATADEIRATTGRRAAETLVVRAGNAAAVQQRAESLATALHGRVISPLQTDLGAQKFSVELPTANVAAFKVQFASVQFGPAEPDTDAFAKSVKTDSTLFQDKWRAGIDISSEVAGSNTLQSATGGAGVMAPATGTASVQNGRASGAGKPVSDVEKGFNSLAVGGLKQQIPTTVLEITVVAPPNQ